MPTANPQVAPAASRRARLGSAGGRGTDPTATSVARMRCDATMHRRLTVVLLAAAASLALLAALPAGAGAQSGGSRFPTVLLSAKTTQGRFQGSFVIRRFRVRAPGLAVFGRLNGRLARPAVPEHAARPQHRPFSFTIALARVPSPSCARIAINFAPRIAPLVGLAATFGPRTLVLRPRRGTGPSTGEFLCGVSAAVAVECAADGDGAPAQRPPSPVRVMARCVVIAVLAVAVAAAVAAPRASAQVTAPSPVPSSRDGAGGRYLLDGPWLLRVDRRDRGAGRHWERRRSTAGWTPITVPNAWNANDRSPSGFIGAPAWYRKDFRLPSRARGLDWRVHFDVGELPRDGLAERQADRSPRGRVHRVHPSAGRI